MQSTRTRRLARLSVSLAFVFAVSNSARANDAVPASGTLSPDNPTLTFTAGPMAVSNESYNAGAPACSPQPVFRCDEYALTVDLPADYAQTHPDDFILMTTSWDD